MGKAVWLKERTGLRSSLAEEYGWTTQLEDVAGLSIAKQGKEMRLGTAERAGVGSSWAASENASGQI
ncbi:unnamed protein product [Prunus armeniaca]|uniref:Uncharacterized protein n=1 Tax=Prunus armeniaca TaxID=36596 RepID=A0A6J5Y595_PRUAR|nr:unnamed protein product [Prunus armeniaca]CAB4319762.1 unnamed protein product [Prunus armeniaca]